MDQVTLPINRYNKLRYALDQLELSEAKSRMALEEANQRIKQLEENLHGIFDFVSQYADFNTATHVLINQIYPVFVWYSSR